MRNMRDNNNLGSTNDMPLVNQCVIHKNNSSLRGKFNANVSNKVKG